MALIKIFLFEFFTLWPLLVSLIFGKEQPGTTDVGLISLVYDEM